MIWLIKGYDRQMINPISLIMNENEMQLNLQHTNVTFKSYLRMTYEETPRENLELYNLIRIYVKLKKVYSVNYGAYFHRAIRMVMNGI